MGLLGNPITQFSINAIIGLLTIIVSIIIFRKQQPNKQITYWAYIDEPFLSLTDKVKDGVKGRVQASFDTRPVSDIRRVVISLWNSGNTPIKEKEFSDPIEFRFGDNAEILEADVSKTTPFSLQHKAKENLKFDIKSVKLEAILLNKREAITFYVI